MVSKEIVEQTISAIEDYCDLAEENGIANNDMSAIGKLLNFWRLYLSLMPKEATNGNITE